jgi:uncharacterized membrane protein
MVHTRRINSRLVIATLKKFQKYTIDHNHFNSYKIINQNEPKNWIFKAFNYIWHILVSFGVFVNIWASFFDEYAFLFVEKGTLNITNSKKRLTVSKITIENKAQPKFVECLYIHLNKWIIFCLFFLICFEIMRTVKKVKTVVTWDLF